MDWKMSSGSEIVLDYILERKTVPDLCASIKDGRYKEQKFRLCKSGVSHVIYLVEGSIKSLPNNSQTLPGSTVEAAMHSTQLTENFFVKHTEDTQETVRYLAAIARKLLRIYRGKSWAEVNRVSSPLYWEIFEVNNSKSKSLTVSEVWGKQLTTLRGISSEKAGAIVRKYPTPRSLLRAYQVSSKENQELLLASVTLQNNGKRKCTIGPASSRLLSVNYGVF